MIKSIRQDLSLRIGLVIFCISTFIGVIYYSYSVHNQELSFNNFVKQHTKNVSDILTIQLWLFDLNTTRDLCLLFSKNREISGFRLLDHKKEIIFEKSVPAAETTLHINKELRYKRGKLVGYLDIYYTSTPWKQERKSAVATGVAIVLGTILGSLILIHFLLKNYLSKPLENLQKSMSLVAQGHFKKSKLTSQKTEVQNIIDAFNNLAIGLQQRDEEISQKTRNLEKEITDRKQTEKLLRKSEEQWEKTFNAMDDIVTIQNEDMQILQANKATFDFLKLGKEDVIGKYCYELFEDIDQPCPECPQLVAAKELKTATNTIHYQESERISLVTFLPVVDKNGKLEHFVHTAKDITQQQKLENELIQAHKMEAIGTLAGGIAHDFNNILAAIIGYAEMVKDDLPDGSHSRSDINQVLKASDRARELVRQILTFSRKEAGSTKPMQPIPVIQEALKLVRSSLPTTVNIREIIDPECGAILANSTQIHQVLVNLCTNAFHALKEEQGSLTVKLIPTELKEHEVMHEPGVSEGFFVELMVSDTGHGMDRRTVSRIFEPYFTTKEFGKGTGMGLALIHGIVQGCGGFIKVESELNRGTTFHVYFPVTEEKSVEIEEEQNRTFPRGDERILVVDDEKIIVDMYQATLERQGYTVTAYTSSKKTLEEFASSPDNFDLIITDQTMPDLPGSELAEKIFQVRKDIPIILCTGYSTMISEQKAMKIGIDRFVMKPVSKRDLTTIVREVLDNRKAASIRQKETAE